MAKGNTKLFSTKLTPPRCSDFGVRAMVWRWLFSLALRRDEIDKNLLLIWFEQSVRLLWFAVGIRVGDEKSACIAHAVGINAIY